MTESEILPHLTTRLLGRSLHLLDSTDSTNTVAKRLALEGAPEGTLILAEEQTAGRGRLGRTWHARPGENLTFSILLRPAMSATAVGLLPLAAGVSVAETLRAELGIDARTKWPNDVLLHDRKICGILSEGVLQSGEVAAAVVGIGLNVNQREFPPELAGSASSLALETGATCDRGRLLAAILGRLEYLYDLLRSGRTDRVIDSWSACSAILGRQVRVSGAGVVQEGTAFGLAADGALLLETDTGLVTIHAGDISLRTV